MKPNKPSLLVTVGLPVFLFALTLHLYIYMLQPLSFPWNDITVELLTVGAALLAAAVATFVWRLFQPGELPRQVWLYFALGLWSFALARSIVFIYFMLYGSAFPVVNFSDIFYMSGVVFFSASLVFQFRLILEPEPGQERRLLLRIGAAILLGAVVVAFALPMIGAAGLTWLTAFRQGFYMFIGMAIMLAAFRLSTYFGSGMWGRAWWGILAFVLAHFMFTILTSGGSYSRSIEFGNPLSLLADTLYLLAYLLTAWACFSQYLLVRFGPTLRRVE